jgi:hypothetical protein
MRTFSWTLSVLACLGWLLVALRVWESSLEGFWCFAAIGACILTGINTICSTAREHDRGRYFWSLPV